MPTMEKPKVIWRPVESLRDCECEHSAHERACKNIGSREIKTAYGTYVICTDCYEKGHLQI